MRAQGIDYGMGLANVDKQTGIRFGIISQHSLDQDYLSDFEADYGEPTCPKCGNKAESSNDACETCEESDSVFCGAKDYHCHGKNCRSFPQGVPYSFWSNSAYSDEANGFYHKDESTLAHYDNSGFGVWIERSEYYTYAHFCSPCAPGACDLDAPLEENTLHTGGYGPDTDKCYCFGHECFESGRAPYRVFRVADNSEVFPKE